MKVIDVQKVESEFVEVDEGDWKTYRRYSADNWEVSIGESWEPYFFCKDIERAYQEYNKLFKRKVKE